MNAALFGRPPTTGPRWVLGHGMLTDARHGTRATPLAALDAHPVDRRTVRELTGQLMTELQRDAQNGPRTPGGAWWLHLHHVPVRRLLSQIVRKLIQLTSCEPYAAAPGPIRPDNNEALIATREGSTREYAYYTVTWSGLAYALGTPTRRDPRHEPYPLERIRTARQPDAGLSEQVDRRTEVLALSWSSRHAQTLLPVLVELQRRRHSAVLMDLATEPSQRPSAADGVPLVRIPLRLLQMNGSLPRSPHSEHERSKGGCVAIGGHHVRLERLEHLAAAMLRISVGSTQPSWHATVATEEWLQTQLAVARPDAVIVANDISPLGALAVHTAERHGAITANLQHGAWTADAISRPALHAQLQVVMGERDAVLARAWAQHPDAEIHVLGQPRFDALKGIDPGPQRQYLQDLMHSAGHHRVRHVVVFACQPVEPLHLARQIRLLHDGLGATQEPWGLVLAPHPTQDPSTLAALSLSSPVPTAVADAAIGARGCLAGADAMATVSSTCGVEAMLLGVPVLELSPHGESTLGLAQQGAAYACTVPHDVTAALDTLTRPRARLNPEAKDNVCRWRGTTTRDIADLIAARIGPTNSRSAVRTGGPITPITTPADDATASKLSGQE